MAAVTLGKVKPTKVPEGCWYEIHLSKPTSELSGFRAYYVFEDGEFKLVDLKSLEREPNPNWVDA